MMATRVAASVNFSKILSSGVGKETGAQLVAFRKRVEDARRAHSQLSNLPDTVNLDEYRGVIKAERILKEFKPVTYDASQQIKTIESFEATAVKQAQESAAKLEAELKNLKETLSNIQDARSFDELSISDVIAARPEIGKTIDEMVKKGKWTVPGYSEKFGSLALL